MKRFITEKRLRKITEVIHSRQQSLRVVLENIHDPHNVSAIYRSCDAVGVPKISLLYTIEKFPKINRVISGSARKWIETEKFTDTQVCMNALRSEGFKILATNISKKSLNLYKIDLTGKIAFILGNEHRGVSKEAASLADETFYIPMHGMVESLNVSVAAAVILYEAQRQRLISGMYKKSELNQKEITELIDTWCKK